MIALQGLDLVIHKGEMISIIGNSGSGKSTLLNMLGGLDQPTAGKLLVDGRDLAKMNEVELIRYKRKTVGFVWQNNGRNLIPYLTAMENVEVPLILTKQKNSHNKAKEMLEMVGLSHRGNNKLMQLSGGEQQRVAIAISLIHQPKILLADEPTGSVDTKTSAKILENFRQLNQSLGITIVIVTHDRQLAAKVDRVIAIRDGRTSSEFIRKTAYSQEFSALENTLEKMEEEHEELAILDKAGRVQVPQEYLELAGLKAKNRVKIHMEDKKIVLISPE